jgi:transcriptional regulator with XRE-family HTH domain
MLTGWELTTSFQLMSEDFTHRTPGQLIQELLDARGWTQKTLAIVLGTSETGMNKIIAGKQALEAESNARYAEARQHTFEDRYNRLMNMILEFNPDFPRPDEKPFGLREAPDYVRESGTMAFVPRIPIREKMRENWTGLYAESFNIWFHFIRGEIQTRRMQSAKVFRVSIRNKAGADGFCTEYALSDFALRGTVPLDYVLEDIFRQMYRGLKDVLEQERKGVTV